MSDTNECCVCYEPTVSAKSGRPQTPSAEDISALAKGDYIYLMQLVVG